MIFWDIHHQNFDQIIPMKDLENVFFSEYEFQEKDKYCDA